MTEEDPKLGATGKFPHGKLNEHDEGELRTAVFAKGGKVVIDFGRSIKWVAMVPEDVPLLVAALQEYANKILKSKKDETGGNKGKVPGVEGDV